MKEIFIFGAGASNASAGTPLGKDLVWSYPQDCSMWAQTGDNGKRDPTDLKETERMFKDFGDFLKLMEKNFPGISEYYKFKPSLQTACVYAPQIKKEYYIDEVMKFLQDKNDVQNIKLIILLG